jgi:hypothetical protein
LDFCEAIQQYVGVNKVVVTQLSFLLNIALCTDAHRGSHSMDRKRNICAISGWAHDFRQQTELKFLSGDGAWDFELVTDFG